MSKVCAIECGYELVQADFTIPAEVTHTGDITAYAPSGKIVVGGGVSNNAPGHISSSYPGRSVVGGPSNKWVANIVFDSPLASAITVTVWAICINE